MSLGEYLSHIDFALAGVVAVVAGVTFLAINHFLQISLEDVFRNLLPGAGRWLGRSAVELAHDDPEEAWFCPKCRSLNVPSATACYRCFRPRPKRQQPEGGTANDAGRSPSV